MPGPDVHSLAARWLASAEGDLALARAAARDDDAPPRGTAFFVQQALEKALKAILVWVQVDFPRTHDLSALATRLPAPWTLSLGPGELDRLTDFAVDVRYPIEEWSAVRPVGDDEARAALLRVTGVLAHITEQLEASGLVRLDKPE